MSRRDSELARYVTTRVVPRTSQPALLPQRDDRLLVLRFVFANLHYLSDTQRLT